MSDTHLPADLRERVARSLAPVRPLPSPAWRTRPFLLFGVIGLAIVPVTWGIRENAAALGIGLWVLSLVQALVAAYLFRRVLAESIPGRLDDRWRVAGWGGLGLALMLGITIVTFVEAPSYVPDRLLWPYMYTCSTRTVLLGIPALAFAGILLRRGLTARPVLAGVLAGLGAGLMADSGWRLYCEVSDPSHVLTAHAGGVLGLSGLGALAGSLVPYVWARGRKRHD
jgi:hypothetical protein